MPVALHALHTQQWADDEPAPPSPTLTNPDNILPSSDRDYSAPTASRAGFARRPRPPSPSYLRERSRPCANPSPASEHAADRDMGRKDNERPGLVSRKMLLLRSRTGGTASNGNLRDARRAHNVSHGSIDSDYTSPILQDVGNLASEQPVQQPEQLQLPDQESRRKSGSSSGLSGMADFLAKYAKPEGAGSDDETVDENAPQFESSEVDAQRRKQELEEYNSAVLSKRAEQILANAKKRLNVMEGNLRGARDLVAPLTAANLKRATSLGSAHSHYMQSGGSYNSRVRYIPQQRHYDKNDREAADQDRPAVHRTLHSQASTPAMGRQYQYQHTRNFSEIQLPDRPFTSLDQHYSGTTLQPRSRTPSRTRATESPTPTSGLRGSKSYDSLGMSGRERPLHNRTSPDSNHLEALTEGDDEAAWRDAVKQRYHHQPSSSQDTNSGLGIYRPASRSSSRTSDLREQMSSLKGRISTLKDRAREDSLRRQSQANLRATETTPFNNAESAAPELFYNPAVSTAREPETLNLRNGGMPDSWTMPGSRNAFAVQAEDTQKYHIQYAKVVEVVAGSTAEGKVKVRDIRTTTSPPRETGHKRSGTMIETRHRRTTSEMATVKAAEKRYSHHQLSSPPTSMPGTFQDEMEDMLAGPPSPPLSNDGFGSSPVLPIMSSNSYIPSTDASIDDDYAASESDAGESVYEDALEYEDEGVVPHEHREDAFDYETFFLSGAMARYNGQRRASDASTGSMSSTETARGPAASTSDVDDNEDVDGYVSDPGVGGIFPPATPQTPERLRAIERSLAERQHASRPLSEESVSSLNSFATAREGDESSDREFEANGKNSPPVSPITESLSRFSSALTLPDRPVSPLSDTGRSPALTSRQDPFTSQARGAKSSDYTEGYASPSPWNSPPRDSPTVDINNRPRTAVRLRRSSSSDRADSGIGSEIKFTVKKAQLSATTHRHGQPSRDLTSVAVNALLDPTGVALGLRDNAVLFGVVESLRHVVREMQRKEEESSGKSGMSSEMRLLMMRRRLERARGALDGGFGGT